MLETLRSVMHSRQQRLASGVTLVTIAQAKQRSLNTVCDLSHAAVAPPVVAHLWKKSDCARGCRSVVLHVPPAA
jgi:hypothetical protein